MTRNVIIVENNHNMILLCVDSGQWESWCMSHSNIRSEQHYRWPGLVSAVHFLMSQVEQINVSQHKLHITNSSAVLRRPRRSRHQHEAAGWPTEQQRHVVPAELQTELWIKDVPCLLQETSARMCTLHMWCPRGGAVNAVRNHRPMSWRLPAVEEQTSFSPSRNQHSAHGCLSPAGPFVPLINPRPPLVQAHLITRCPQGRGVCTRKAPNTEAVWYCCLILAV